MQVKKLIADSFPPLKITDSGSRALHWMDALQTGQLPVIDGTVFKGVISRKDILSQSEPGKPVGSFDIVLSKSCLIENQHIFDAVAFAANFKQQIIPVTDESGNYSGVITLQNLINNLANFKSMRLPGSIIVLEADKKKNPLSQLIEIAEANEGEVMTADVEASENTDQYRATLKINRADLSRIQSAYFRNNINVAAIYHHSDFTEDLQQRFDSLMNYLNI